MDKQTIEQAMRDVRLFVATPCYSGNVTSEYLQSIIGFTRLATSIGLKFHVFTSKNESLVTRARNRAVAAMRKTDATHLMFIDADIGFDPFSVFAMIMRDVDVVAASYPVKGVEWGQLLGRKFKTVPEIQDASIRHVINGMGERGKPEDLVEVSDAGTGFMLIKRDVLERMIVEHSEWEYQSEDEEQGVMWHAVFDCEIEDGRYLSEDYTFCRRWQRMGGKIWLDPLVTLTHTGSFTFGFSE